MYCVCLLYILAKVIIPLKGINIHEHCPTGISYICEISLTPCQMLEKRYKKESGERRGKK